MNIGTQLKRKREKLNRPRSSAKKNKLTVSS